MNELTRGSMIISLSGATNDLQPSVLISKGSGDGASDRWKLQPEEDESCRAD